MNKKLNFEVESVSVEDSMPKSKFAKISLDFFASGDNAHELYVSEEVLNKTAETIFNVPIVWEYDASLDDAGSHDPLEVPCGFVKDNATIERVKLPDGRTMLRTIAYIWKRYSGRLMEILERDDGKKPVSVEMSVYETQIDDDDGKEHLLDYVFEAITILGTFMQPAIESAGLNVLSFSQEKEDYERAYRKEFAKYADVDFTISEDVKSNCQDGLDIYEEFEHGGTSVSLAMARYIVKNENITEKKVRKMSKYFSVKGGRDKPEDIESKEFVSWRLYGGSAAKEWSSNLVDEMNVENESLMAYFEEGNNSFPNKTPLSEDSEGKEKKNMEDKDEKEVTEEVFEDTKPEDEEVSMADGDTPEAEEDMAVEDESKDEEEEDSDESEEDMACGDKEKMGLEFALTAQSLRERLQVALDGHKYGEYDWSIYGVVDHDEEYVYVRNWEDYKIYRMKYTVSDDMSVSVEISQDEEIIFSPELVGEAVANQKEFAMLKEFKANVEKQQFEIKISGVLGTVKHLFDTDGLAELRQDAVDNYSLETITGWENLVKAKAFTVSENLPDVEEEDDGVLKMALVEAGGASSEAYPDSLWD